ncbi:DNA repair protein REV1 [Megalops cyprinoides]|uniref:DNA repair protein REV1 n=1 Tax=Megalops cyprinoides TaxID=118141 RepID=UPI0018656ABE|nr:DNA repair protein REV1 [Megalops cyprinoides]
MNRDGWRKRADENDGWGGRGGYMSSKVSKLDEQFRLDAPKERQKEGSCSSIFRGVAIYVNGYTDPTADELRRLMMLHGGQYHMYYSRSKTTHIIATNLPNFKIQELKGEKVVRPEWITDSVRAGHLLPYLQYQLYAKQKGLCFPTGRVVQAQEPAGPSRFPSHAYSELNHTRSELDHTHHKLNHTHHELDHTHNNLNHTHYVQDHAHPKQNHTPRVRRELDFRLNGSGKNCVDLLLESKMNGVRQEGCSPSDRPLTNGHAHPANGALKPLDLVLHPGRAPIGLQQHQSPPPHPPTLDRPQASPSRMDSRQVSGSPGMSTRHPLSWQRPAFGSPTTQKPALQPSANQNTAAIPKPHLQSPLPQSPGPEKPLPHSGADSPQCSRVRLNGAHHSPHQDPSPRPLSIQDLNDSPGRHQPTEAWDSISGYYSLSRFHHISTWKNEFCQYVHSLQQQRRAQGGAVFPGRERLRRQRAAQGAGSPGPAGAQNRQPCILHVDMDCFFVSVGIRNRLDLKGKPVAVTSNRGPGLAPLRHGANYQLEVQYYQRRRAQSRAERREGVLDETPSPESPDTLGNGADPDLSTLSMAEIASCSYEARRAGVRNGMFFGQAKRLCPGLQAVPYDFQAYKEVALALYETLASYTHDLEALSCDEALLDASGLLGDLGVSPDELASAIRADVKERTGCSASVGMGSNILLAKMATRKAKPDGQHYLKPEEVDDFIRDQSVTSLPGVGRSLGLKLASLGVRTCGDLQQMSLSRLQRELGPRTGQTLFRFCRGLDDRPVRSEKERKSVSAEINYGIRFTQVSEAESFLRNFSLEMERRLRGFGLRGRRLTLKILVRKPGAPVEPAKFGGHGICDSLSRQVTLEQATDSGELIGSEVVKLFHSMQVNVLDVRGVGLHVHQLLRSRPASQDPSRPRSIRDMLLARRSASLGQPATPEGSPTPAPTPDGSSNQSIGSPTIAPPPHSSSTPTSSSTDPVPGTSKAEPPPRYNGGFHTPSHGSSPLNLSIEVPSPSQVDHSVLDALPPEIRQQVERSWRHREELPNYPAPPPSTPPAQPPGTLILQIPDQSGQAGPTGIILALPDVSQVDPDVFAALPPELQEELQSAYVRRVNAQPQSPMASRNALLLLKPPGPSPTKRCNKRKNMSPAKKMSPRPSPLKSRLPGNSPAKSSPVKPLRHALRHRDMSTDALKPEVGPSTSSLKPDVPKEAPRLAPSPSPSLAGACDLTDIQTLLRDWVTTIPEPMEEDILQVVKYCTELIEDRDLEKLDLVIKHMKRLMQQSVESVWSMAFDFILDNVQVVVQQTYGSTLKVT